MKTHIQTLFLGLTLLAGVYQAAAAVLLSDDFNSNVLDTSKWSTDTTSFQETDGTPMVVVTNQRCEITCRGHLNTVADYDPSTPGGLLITGTWTFVHEGYNPDTPWIVTRSSGVPVAPWGEISDGVNFRVYVGSPGTIDLYGNGGATVTGLNIVSNTLNLAQGDSVNFTITDDGTNLSYFVAKIGDPTQAASATAICTDHLAANKISFYNTQFSYDTAALDNVVIQTIPSIMLTNIVISPASPIIAAGSNQQFTATGQYSDGSSQVLTNGGSGGSGIWTAVAGMPAAKGADGSAAVNGQLFVVSGDLSDNTVYDFDPTVNAWTSVAVLPDNFAFPGVAGVGNKLYFFGGGESSDMRINVSSELYIYDTLTDGWNTGAAMNLQRAEMGVGVINGKIYAAGGAGNYYSSYGDLQIYDPASNTWTTGQAMPTACSAGGAAVINGKLYVVGGYSDTGIGVTTTPLDSLYVYDPTTDSWTTKSPMPTARGNLGAAAVNGLLYAIDGSTASGEATNLVEVYNPVTDSWSTGAPTLIAHTYLQPVAINGTIYIAGNGPGNASITNAESYTPQNLLWSSGSPSVASVDTNGLATGLTNGSTTITAVSGSVSGNTILTVVVNPTISIQPTNNTVSPNGSVTLNVAATGGSLGYQWQLNGTNISGATSASLTITNVSSASIGVYTVIVSNAAGNVTSSSVMVTSVDIHMLASVYVNGPLGSNYLIQATSDLPGGWTTLTNLALPSQPYIYVDYSSVTNKQQYYRAVPQ